MKTVAVLLARGESKGIPKKNIKKIAGKPLISYGIRAALGAGLETWVSTDDSEIAQVAIEYGANILMRPAEFATDKASSESALLHFAESVEFDRLVFIQPTSPLLRSFEIEQGLEMMEEYDSVFSGYEQHWYPHWKRFPTAEGGKDEFWPLWGDLNSRPRRQDVPSEYVENGAFYITSKERLLEYECRYSGKIGCYLMPFSRSFQIDTLDDIGIIEAIIEQYK